jgi:hypothetical protein
MDTALVWLVEVIILLDVKIVVCRWYIRRRNKNMNYEVRGNRVYIHVATIKPSTRDLINQRLNEIENCKHGIKKLEAMSVTSHMKAVLHLAIDEEICKLKDEVVELMDRL